MSGLSRALTLYRRRGVNSVFQRAAEEAYWALATPWASLPALGARCGTDKGTDDHAFFGQSYLDIYEDALRPLRRQPITLLEIGVLGGGSLAMWARYFRQGRIVGLDIDPACAAYAGGRVAVEIGSQADPATLARVAACGPFDVIIDDGSHVNVHMLASFRSLWPALKPGGRYFIEDMACTYSKLDTDGVRERWPGMALNPASESLDNDRALLDDWFHTLIRDMDHWRGEVCRVQFWSNLCCLTKGPGTPDPKAGRS